MEMTRASALARLIMEAPHLQGYAALNIESWNWLVLFNWFVASFLGYNGGSILEKKVASLLKQES